MMNPLDTVRRRDESNEEYRVRQDALRAAEGVQPIRIPEPETPPLTVRQLIAELQKLPEETLDWEVTTEGCDCYGDIGRVEVADSYIFLART